MTTDNKTKWDDMTDEEQFVYGAKLVTKTIFGLFVFLLLWGSFYTINAAERGVVLTFGAFNGTIAQPGLNFKIPFVQSVTVFDVRTAKLEIEKSESYSKDLQAVGIHSVVNYNIDPQTVSDIYRQYGEGYESKVLLPALEATVKQIVAKYSAEELLNKRGEVQAEIEKAFKAAIPSVFVVTKYAMVNEEFSPTYEAAIEKKQVAQQDAERAENELKKVKIEAEQRVAQAQAEARAIELQSNAASNEKYVSLKALEVQLEAVKRWNGVLPAQMIPNGSLPFINVTK